MNKKGILIAAVAVLVIAIIGVTYLLFTEKQANRELVQEFQLDKEDLENEYTRFAQQYDELKMTISNDSLSQLLEQEQLKTQRLLEELRTVKSSNATEIRRLKKELATLRKVMIGYINQIDSLNKLTAQQKQVIAEVTQKYNQASRQIDNLSEEKKNLDKKVTLAAQLDATNIRVEPRNKRGKVAKKVKDVVKLAISFTIVKNITAENGERTVYIRITKPDNDVLTKSASNTFPYENRTLTYSIKKYIEYNGAECECVLGCGRILVRRKLSGGYFRRRQLDRFPGVHIKLSRWAQNELLRPAIRSPHHLGTECIEKNMIEPFYHFYAVVSPTDSKLRSLFAGFAPTVDGDEEVVATAFHI